MAASLHPGCEFERGMEGGRKTREEERTILCSRVTEEVQGHSAKAPFSSLFLCCCDNNQEQLEEETVCLAYTSRSISDEK